MIRVKRAVLSVSDKRGLAAFARGLARLGVEIYSTGGTYKALAAARVRCRKIESLTGWPEILGGRVKTIHPRLHGGVLLRRGRAGDRRDARAHGILAIDLVCVNLYPFEQVAARRGASRGRVLEEIDIGGPTLLRAAAKNYPHVLAVCDPGDYARVLDHLRKGKGGAQAGFSEELARKVFERTAAYDQHIASYFAADGAGQDPMPPTLTLHLAKAQTLRYGENPHQRAALYRDLAGPSVELAQAQGRELSYNNYLDVEAVLGLVAEFREPAAAVVKHQNPCGVAAARRLADALAGALAGDRDAAFGGVVGVNRKVDGALAALLLRELSFFEVIAAPGYAAGALRRLAARKTLRVLTVPLRHAGRVALRSSEFGYIAQERDLREPEAAPRWRVVTRARPSAADVRALRFAWTVAKHVRSNAIVLAQARGRAAIATVGIGAGQMSRVDAVRLACLKAGERARGAVLASDGFFPMPDNVDVAWDHGIRVIVQPGGSIRDGEVIKAADRAGIPMVFTGTRHFKH